MKVLGLVILIICLLGLAVLIGFEIKALVNVIKNRKKQVNDDEKKGE